MVPCIGGLEGGAGEATAGTPGPGHPAPLRDAGPSRQGLWLEGFCGPFTSLVHRRATDVSPPRTRGFARWDVYLLLNFSLLQETVLLRIPGIPAANFMPQFLLNAVGVWASYPSTLCLSSLIYAYTHLQGAYVTLSLKML